MTFLTFLGYFIASTLIYRLTFFGCFLLFRKFKQRQFEKKVANGEIKVMSMEDMMRLAQQQQGEDALANLTKPEKKTWN